MSYNMRNVIVNLATRGGSDTFTSSDKAVLAELIEREQALIAVADDGAEGVPFDPTGTGLTAENVQAAIIEVAEGDNYSTTETDTGKTWIDGKKIYQRVFEFESALVVGPSSWVSTGLTIANLGKIIKADSMNVTVTYYPVMADYQDNDVKLLSCRDGNVSVSYLVLQYTKVEED